MPYCNLLKLPKMKTGCYFMLCLLITLCSCSGKQSSGQQMDQNDTARMAQELKIPELEGGDIFYKDKDPFGPDIELKGEQVIADTVIFQINQAEALIKGDQLLLKTGRSLMLFRLPEMKFLGYKGRFGDGPDEFRSPRLVETPDTTLLCYLFESTNQKLYKVDRQGEISSYPYAFTKAQSRMYSDKDIKNIADADFIYAETSSTGKSIFRTHNTGDSIGTKLVFDLGLNPKIKSWTAYIGDFAVNPSQNRMVYAYKYFKLLKFMDMDARAVRTIDFEREKYDENTIYKVDGMDQNVTHYWGVCPQEKYVYFLYSGRTPAEVWKENNQKKHYIYVEQYDWNGNPIHRYKLDQWGYFTVDEKNKKLYLLSTNHDDPFFVYPIPE